ncbi:hypothetical protein ASZ90_015012 [hydrocarbon metagenome]|uniref:Uncharacterized protein n=1 Tax=hydrocarbon metagenome TaxID=938273 RepID=A0A0W8F347_9ZZZZ
MEFLHIPDRYPMSFHCPSCGSTALVLEAGGYGGMVYRCKECGYRGPLVVESDARETIKGGDTGAREHILQEEGERFRVPLWVRVLAVVFVLVLLVYRF